jgi:hypothetical protein
MPTLLTILATLFIALMLLIPLIERFAPRPNAEQTVKISRWILPLVGIMLIIGLFKSFQS